MKFSVTEIPSSEVQNIPSALIRWSLMNAHTPFSLLTLKQHKNKKEDEESRIHGSVSPVRTSMELLPADKTPVNSFYCKHKPELQKTRHDGHLMERSRRQQVTRYQPSEETSSEARSLCEHRPATPLRFRLVLTTIIRSTVGVYYSVNGRG